MATATLGVLFDTPAAVAFTTGTVKLTGNNGAGSYALQTYTEISSGDSRNGWAQASMPGMPFHHMV